MEFGIVSFSRVILFVIWLVIILFFLLTDCQDREYSFVKHFLKFFYFLFSTFKKTFFFQIRLENPMGQSWYNLYSYIFTSLWVKSLNAIFQGILLRSVNICNYGRLCNEPSLLVRYYNMSTVVCSPENMFTCVKRYPLIVCFQKRIW